MYEPMMIRGAKVILLKLKISSLNMLGSDEPPPLISIKPKVSKLTIRSNATYLFFWKIMFLIAVHAKTQRFI